MKQDDTIDITLLRRVRPLPSVYVRDVGDESIVLNMETEQYIGLDAVARSMWEALTTSGTVADATAVLLDEYNVEPDRLAADIATFIETLAMNNLATVEPAA